VYVDRVHETHTVKKFPCGSRLNQNTQLQTSLKWYVTSTPHPLSDPGTLSANPTDTTGGAPQIIETFHEGDVNGEVEDLPEARLMEEVVHPNVIQTYKHGTRYKKTTSNRALSFDLGVNGSGSILETWLLLEYCNKGTLQAHPTSPSGQRWRAFLGGGSLPLPHWL